MGIKDRKMRIILYICMGIIILYPLLKLMFISSNIFSISIIENAYNEARDYVSFRMSHLAYNGINPYSKDVFEKTNVPFILLYTGLYPLLIAILCRITGLNILTGYYIVNVFLVLLTFINVWYMVKDAISSCKVYVAICTCINTCTFFALFGLPIFNFHTDTIGIFFMSVIILLVKKEKSTWLMAIMSVCLIFTKQILIVMVVPLFVYLFILERKKAYAYFVECFICGVGVFAIIQLLFPLYWTETIYFQFFVSKSYGSFIDAVKNVVHLFYRYWIFVLIICIENILNLARQKFSLVRFIKTTIQDKYKLYMILNILFGTIFLLYFAKCGEDGYKYCQDILAINIYILALYSIKKILAAFNDHSNSEKKYNRFMAISLIILGVATTITYSHFDSRHYTKSDVDNMVTLDSLISMHEGEAMYLGINSTQYMLNRDIWEDKNIWFNDGQIQYFYEKYPDNWLGKFFYAELIQKEAEEYVSEVNKMIKNKEFKIVTTCIDEIVDQDALIENYNKVYEIPMMTDTNYSFEVVVWLPKE